MGCNRIAVFVVMLGMCAPLRGAEPRHWSELRMPDGVNHVKLPIVRADDYLFTRVSINGQDGGWFMIDTGANGCMLSNKATQKFKLQKYGAINVNAPGGTQSVKGELYEINSMSFAGISVGPRLIMSTDLERLPFIGEKLSGIIGTDVLSQMPFTLDLREPSLTFHRPGKIPAAAPGATLEKLRIFNNWPAVQASVEGNAGWFLVDTGSSGVPMELFAPFMALHPEMLKGKHVHSNISFGMGGIVDSQSTSFTSFSIMSRTMNSAHGTCLRGMSGRGGNVDFTCAGAVGIGTLDDWRVTFDFAGEKIWIEFPPKENLDDYIQRIEAQAKTDLVATAPLLRALDDYRIDAVNLLLQRGADPNTKGLGGATALMTAACWPEAIKPLLARGADVNAVSVLKADSTLIWAAQYGSVESVKILLAAGAKVNYANTMGETALLRAAEANYPEVIQLLLDAKAEINCQAKNGSTPLSMAVSNKQPEALSLILQHHPKVDSRNAEGISPLMIAAEIGNLDALNQLIKAGANVDLTDANGRTALFWAAHTSDSKSARSLIKGGANTQFKDRAGYTAWDVAMEYNADDVLQVLRYEAPTTKPAK
jgi:ankyrin repeat protein